MYLWRNETNFRVVSKTTAQGSVPCVKKDHKIALPKTNRGRMIPISRLKTARAGNREDAAARWRAARKGPAPDHSMLAGAAAAIELHRNRAWRLGTEPPATVRPLARRVMEKQGPRHLPPSVHRRNTTVEEAGEQITDGRFRL